MRVPVIASYNNVGNFSSAKRESFSLRQSSYMTQGNDTVSFSHRIPKETSVALFNITNTLTKEIKAIGAPIYLYNDGSQKALLIAQQVKKSLLDIKSKGLDIPKMKIRFDCWDDIYDNSAAAETSADIYKNRVSNLYVNFNTPLYRNISDSNQLYRSSKDPFETSLEMDLLHEFAHAYQSFNNHAKYTKLKYEKFSEDINKEILDKMGIIATESKAEFVAEYFAHKMVGKEVKSKTLAKLYEECLGPKFN